MGSMSVKEKVDYLTNKQGTNNPFKISEELGLLVVYEPLGSILGYYSKSHRTKVIHINESATEQQQLFICAHELGHAVLHPDVNAPFLKSNTYFPTDPIEVEANTFAVELLMSRWDSNPITIQEATELYGVPKQLMINFYP